MLSFIIWECASLHVQRLSQTILQKPSRKLTMQMGLDSQQNGDPKLNTTRTCGIVLVSMYNVNSLMKVLVYC